MWPYYGSKSKVVDKYPAPIYDTIIEPFAGSARYSLKYWEKEVILYDKFKVIIDVWNYLQNTTPLELLALPDVSYKEDLRNFTQLSEAEKLLIGFCIGGGSAAKRNIAQKFNSWSRDKLRMANNLYKIKHWKIYLDDYKNIKRRKKATWFIDPPYQVGGYVYPLGTKTIDYPSLAEWCMKRRGQVMVCENSKSTWMDFKFLANYHGQMHNTEEVMWYNEN